MCKEQVSQPLSRAHRRMSAVPVTFNVKRRCLMASNTPGFSYGSLPDIYNPFYYGEVGGG